MRASSRLEFGHVAGMGFGRRLRELSRLLDRALAARVHVSEPSTLVTLETMVRRGLVERRQGEADRRKTHVYLTARGRALRPKVLPDVAAATAACYAGVSPRELTAALKLFEKIAANADAER